MEYSTIDPADNTVPEDGGTMEEDNADTVEDEENVDTVQEDENIDTVKEEADNVNTVDEEEENVDTVEEEEVNDSTVEEEEEVNGNTVEEEEEVNDNTVKEEEENVDTVEEEEVNDNTVEEEEENVDTVDEDENADTVEEDEIAVTVEEDDIAVTVEEDESVDTVEEENGGVESSKKEAKQPSPGGIKSGTKGAAATTKDSSKNKKGVQKENTTKSDKDSKPGEAKEEKVKKTIVKKKTTTPKSGVATTSSSKTNATNSHSKTKSKSGKDGKDATSSSTQKTKDVKASIVKDVDTKKSSRPIVPQARTSKTIVVPRVPASSLRSVFPSRTRSHYHASRHSALSFEHIRELRERERQRERELEWRRREREQHWNRDTVHKRRMQDLERRNAEELAQLEREREKLRMEREKVEREKQKIIRMMQERTRVERDLIEKEKDDLRRTQVRVVDERLSRNHKRPFEDDSKERARSREYSERKKLAVEPRRYDHHSFVTAPIISATTTRTVNSRIAVPERRDAGHYVRDSRDQRIRHRSKSRSYSPGRDGLHARSSPVRERAAAAVYAPREVGWERERAASRDVHHREKQVDLKRDVPDVRHQRIARDRAMLGPTPPPPSRRPVQADYPLTTTRSEGYHRAVAIPIVKMRPPERYDVKSVRQNDSTYDSRGGDSWLRRASYNTTTTNSSAQVQHQQLPSSSSSGRDWMTERKNNNAWPIADSRLTVRGINDERWVSGSGNAVNSMRSGSGLPLVAPPPPIFHQHTVSSSAVTHPYVNDRYGGYNSKSTVIRRY